METGEFKVDTQVALRKFQEDRRKRLREARGALWRAVRGPICIMTCSTSCILLTLAFPHIFKILLLSVVGVVALLVGLVIATLMWDAVCDFFINDRMRGPGACLTDIYRGIEQFRKAYRDDPKSHLR